MPLKDKVQTTDGRDIIMLDSDFEGTYQCLHPVRNKIKKCLPGLLPLTAFLALQPVNSWCHLLPLAGLIPSTGEPTIRSTLDKFLPLLAEKGVRECRF